MVYRSGPVGDAGRGHALLRLLVVKGNPNVTFGCSSGVDKQPLKALLKVRNGMRSGDRRQAGKSS